MHAPVPCENNSDSRSLQRSLSYRHVKLIAIGGAIGAGLFLGSGHGIAKAGPALLVAFALTGVFIFFIARALGELLVFNPGYRSFAEFAHDMLGPWAGFVTGWSYWLNWILVGVAELTAIGLLTHFWFPDVPQWIPALAALVVLSFFNYLSVRYFGEIEFWIAIIKVVTIVTLIVSGIYLIAVNIGNPLPAPSLRNLWEHGGFAPNGWGALIAVLPIAGFAFGGMEILGLLAAETNDPQRNIPKAVNGIPLRIGVFYIGSMAVVMAIFPWDQLDASQSPFILSFQEMGLLSAAGIMNFVVITSIASSCNSGLFATSRMLYSLALCRQAPKALGQLNRRSTPVMALMVSSLGMLLGVLLNIFFPGDIFGYLMAGVLLLLLWIWGVILVSHLVYRRRVHKGECAASSFRLPGAPYTNYLGLGFVVLLAGLVIADPDTRVAAAVAPVWFISLTVIFYGVSRNAKASVNGAKQVQRS